MVLELGISVIVLSFGSVVRPPLPSTGSLRAGSPASSVLRETPTSSCLSRWLRSSLAWRYRPALAVRTSRRQAPQPEKPGLDLREPDPVVFESGDMRISQVPWKPVERVPRSSTPVVDEDSTLFVLVGRLPLVRERRPTTTFRRFRSSVTRPTFSLCTLRRRGYPSSTQHSLPGGGAPPCLNGNFTRWVSLLSLCSWISYIRGLLSARASWRTAR
jgi:hypothetical protein